MQSLHIPHGKENGTRNGNQGNMLGLSWGYIGIMEKKMGKLLFRV